ncbi:hypothetical protein [Fictibacillus enclensis]|uniref:hypothetical protein n=1 Tax=Fictibacillus enclensis TaxID=1017270 RepID=UPI0025A17FC3|nr:hypothetical protein [Fictibacillus enclensis]
MAHLSPPYNADYFVRKDGAGGDAGAECYWRLSHGSEYAWQAKYFLDASQWKQISDSVETAQVVVHRVQVSLLYFVPCHTL